MPSLVPAKNDDRRGDGDAFIRQMAMKVADGGDCLSAAREHDVAFAQACGRCRTVRFYGQNQHA